MVKNLIFDLENGGSTYTRVNTVVMQCFQVVYHGISHESLVFSQYTHKPLGQCVYKKIQVMSGILHGIVRESVA